MAIPPRDFLAEAVAAGDESRDTFSMKLANLKASLAVPFAYYDFCRVHATLRVTPAMAAGVNQKMHVFGFLRTMTA